MTCEVVGKKKTEREIRSMRDRTELWKKNKKLLFTKVADSSFSLAYLAYLAPSSRSGKISLPRHQDLASRHECPVVLGVHRGLGSLVAL